MSKKYRSPSAVSIFSFVKLPLMLIMLCCVASGCRSYSDLQNAEGVRQHQLGQYDAAMASFNQAINTDHQNANSYYNLAATVYEKGKRDGVANYGAQAENYYYQCLERNPNHLACHRALAVFYIEQGKPEKAFKLMEDWTMKNPISSEPKVELARLYEEFGDPETAKVHLRSAIGVEQNNPRAFAALASLQETQGNYQQALQNYQHARRLNGNQAGVAQRIATLQRSITPGAGLPTPSGSRIVTQPSGTIQR